jgi:hypothetical protein
MRIARGVVATPRDSGSDNAERSDAEEDDKDPDYQEPEAAADDEGDHNVDSEQSENEYEGQQVVAAVAAVHFVKKQICSVSKNGKVLKDEATAECTPQEAREATRPEQPAVKSPKDVHEEQEPRNSKSVIAILGNVGVVNEQTLRPLDKQLLPASLHDIPQMKSWIRQLAQSGWWDLHRILTLYRGEVPCDEAVFALAHHASKHMRHLQSTTKKGPTSDLFEVLLTPTTLILFYFSCVYWSLLSSSATANVILQEEEPENNNFNSNI